MLGIQVLKRPLFDAAGLAVVRVHMEEAGESVEIMTMAGAREALQDPKVTGMHSADDIRACLENLEEHPLAKDGDGLVDAFMKCARRSEIPDITFPVIARVCRDCTHHEMARREAQGFLHAEFWYAGGAPVLPGKVVVSLAAAIVGLDVLVMEGLLTVQHALAILKSMRDMGLLKTDAPLVEAQQRAMADGTATQNLARQLEADFLTVAHEHYGDVYTISVTVTLVPKTDRDGATAR